MYIWKGILVIIVNEFWVSLSDSNLITILVLQFFRCKVPTSRVLPWYEGLLVLQELEAHEGFQTPFWWSSVIHVRITPIKSIVSYNHMVSFHQVNIWFSCCLPVVLTPLNWEAFGGRVSWFTQDLRGILDQDVAGSWDFWAIFLETCSYNFIQKSTLNFFSSRQCTINII